MIDFEDLHSVATRLLCYDPETGVFTRRRDHGRRGRYKAGEVVGCVSDTGYLTVRLDYNTYLLHRIAFVIMGINSRLHVDHINGIRTDNRFSNLRLVRAIDNCRNSSLSTKNRSGVIGVHQKPNKKWVAQIKVDGKRHHIGVFDDLEDAALARKRAEQQYGFHPNHGKTRASVPTRSCGEI